jgi:hypothetical protein
MIRDARETAQGTFMSNFVLDKAAAAGDVVRRIAPYGWLPLEVLPPECGEARPARLEPAGSFTEF